MKALGEVVASLTAGGQIHTTGNLPAPSAGRIPALSEPQRTSAITGPPLRDSELQSMIGRLLGESGYGAITKANDPALPWQGTALNRLANICERQSAPPSSIAEARRAMRELLRPAPEEPMATRIMAFMAHFYDPKMGEAMRSVVLLDWCRMLGEYPLWAIESAMDQWLSKEERRPTPKMILDRIPYAVRSPSIRAEAL